MGTKSILDREPVDIIIPTMDNVDQLMSCIESILATRDEYPLRIIVVNNGSANLNIHFQDYPEIVRVIDTEKNLGWTGGLIEGLKHSSSKYVLFCNDDIYVPAGSYRWLSQMVRHLVLRPWLAAVGPSSNCVMGAQSIFFRSKFMCSVVPFLIGFCMLVRRSALDEIGGPDPEFETGDDMDLSIRFRKAGYMMLVDSSIFVYHHGFQTGEKVYGKPDKPGGWNSRQMTEDTNMHLIRKHGFLEWWKFSTGQMPEASKWPDERLSETQVVISHVNGCDPSLIVDLGCGGNKTVEGSIGVDIKPPGDHIRDTPYSSVADITADVEKRLPFEDGQFKTVIARHVLEHCTDLIGAMEEWKRIMADDGKMIIAVPDERYADTIILNPQHVHAFTPVSLANIAGCLDLKVNKIDEWYGGDSFVMVLERA